MVHLMGFLMLHIKYYLSLSAVSIVNTGSLLNSMQSFKDSLDFLQRPLCFSP